MACYGCFISDVFQESRMRACSILVNLLAVSHLALARQLEDLKKEKRKIVSYVH